MFIVTINESNRIVSLISGTLSEFNECHIDDPNKVFIDRSVFTSIGQAQDFSLKYPQYAIVEKHPVSISKLYG